MSTMASFQNKSCRRQSFQFPQANCCSGTEQTSDMPNKLIYDKLEAHFSHFAELCSEIGAENSEIQKWQEDFMFKIEGICAGQVEHIEALREKVCKRIDHLKVSINDLQDELELPRRLPEVNSNLSDFEKVLLEKEQELQHKREQMLEALKPLCNEFANLQHFLDVEGPFELKTNLTVSRRKNVLEKAISSMRVQKMNACSQLELIRSKVAPLLKKLEYDTSMLAPASFAMLEHKMDDLVLSEANIGEFREFASSLENEALEVEMTCSSLRSSVALRWNRLKHDPTELDDILQATSDITPTVVKKLRDIDERLQEECRKNGLTVLREMANELIALREECWELPDTSINFSELERAGIPESSIDSILEKFEQKLNSIKEHRDKYIDVFNWLEKYEFCWKVRKETEERKLDPNRLNNRGGGLLQEEKRERAAKKELESVVNSLAKFCKGYCNKTGQEFLIKRESFESLHGRRLQEMDEFILDVKQRQEAMKQKAKVGNSTGRVPPAKGANQLPSNLTMAAGSMTRCNFVPPQRKPLPLGASNTTNVAARGNSRRRSKSANCLGSNYSRALAGASNLSSVAEKKLEDNVTKRRKIPPTIKQVATRRRSRSLGKRPGNGYYNPIMLSHCVPQENTKTSSPPQTYSHFEPGMMSSVIADEENRENRPQLRSRIPMMHMM